MRCQRQLLNIHWSDHVTNMSVQESTGLTTINQYLRRQRLSIFGHIARLDPAVPADAALRLAVDTKEGRRLDPSWSRRPGRPRHTWADQVREDAGIPLSTLWSAEVAKGHRVARRSSTRRQWWWWQKILDASGGLGSFFPLQINLPLMLTGD